MWKYVQSTGQMFAPDGELLATGYAGHWDGSLPVGGPNDHRNKPADQTLHKLGPLPVGKYTIEQAISDPKLGPLTMHLTPDPDDEMFGRSLFRIHGDSSAHPGQASEGCIILNRTARQTISNSSDRDLVVVAQLSSRY